MIKNYITTDKFPQYPKMFVHHKRVNIISTDAYGADIVLRIHGYQTFYEIIRGLNHEELHCILRELVDLETSSYLDRLIHNAYGDNSKFREELYELASKDTMSVSKEQLIR